MKDKRKSLVKEAKKTAQKSIQQSLLTQLKEVTAGFGNSSVKLEKQIKKEAKKLSKKFTKFIKIEKAALVPVVAPAPAKAADKKPLTTK
jgi:hypothetical protein